MVKNAAGGYVFSVDDWVRLERFLILGAEGGTYYVKEREITLENVAAVLRCLKKDGRRVVEMTRDISVSDRAPKNAPAIFVLALAASPKFADPEANALALNNLQLVARIGTDLFAFVEAVNLFRGWGRSLRTAVGRWYTDKKPEGLAYQLLKYQQRGGWSHRDVLRLSHPTPTTESHSALMAWAVGRLVPDDGFLWGLDVKDSDGNVTRVPLGKEGMQSIGSDLDQIEAYERAKRATEESEIISLISDFRLTREMIPTKWLNSAGVWAALLNKMPLGAMVRNLGKMTNVGLLVPGSESSALIASRLGDKDDILRARIHPIGVLFALKTYAQGKGFKGHLEWSPVKEVVDALDSAFYLAFGNLPDLGSVQRLVAVDSSGSMESKVMMADDYGPLSCREAGIVWLCVHWSLRLARL